MITVQEVLDTLAEVVKGREEFIYSPGVSGVCHYANSDGTASCLAGQVIARLAPETFQEVVAFETQLDGVSFAVDGLDIGDPYRDPKMPVLDAEPDVFLVLRAAQRTQDNGYTWGEAYENSQFRSERLGNK